MANADNPAFPVGATPGVDDTGLTKREYVAILVLQGILANRRSINDDDGAVARALTIADALLA